MTGQAAGDRRGRGFTLVELITVMGIIGILISLVLSAVYSATQGAARTNTEALFKTLDSALSRYKDDWTNYPWHNATGTQYPSMGVVRVDYNPLVPIASNPAFAADGKEAALAAALGMGERKGPYLPAGTQMTDRQVASSAGAVYTYRLIVDGWGRPIRYYPPDLAVATQRLAPDGGTVTYVPNLAPQAPGSPYYPTYRYVGPPVIESRGSEENDDRDNMFNAGGIQ
jgi:prepilin-type N-terminal cleavage/methylation domain-containing protein